jgi:uncharacterized membrane protein YkvA (DUF1232 family)
MMDRLKRVTALLGDPRVAKLPRFAVLAAIAYLISPIDLVPDFVIPLVGWLDDATLVWLSVRWLLKSDPSAPKQLE